MAQRSIAFGKGRYLTYALHHLQIKFQLQIEIFYLKFQIAIEIELGKWLLIGSIYIISFADEISIANFNLNLQLKVNWAIVKHLRASVS